MTLLKKIQIGKTTSKNINRALRDTNADKTTALLRTWIHSSAGGMQPADSSLATLAIILASVVIHDAIFTTTTSW